MSFSVDDNVEQKIAAWAKRDKKSKSAVLRDLVVAREFEEYLTKVQQRMEPVLAELGLEAEDDIYRYLESPQTYSERRMEIATRKAK